jgi:type IV pilus assembly protein PilP
MKRKNEILRFLLLILLVALWISPAAAEAKKQVSVPAATGGIVGAAAGSVAGAAVASRPSSASPASPAVAATSQPSATTPPPAPAKGTAPPDSSLIFHFDPAGKPDPFKPFVDAELALKKRQQEMKLLAEKQKLRAVPLSPLQRLDIGQFKLVGIAGNEGGRKAVVQDMKGKFYPITVGTLMGLNSARVFEIRENSVLLEEPPATKSAKAKKKIIEMKLRKEGDEGTP